MAEVAQPDRTREHSSAATLISRRIAGRLVSHSDASPERLLQSTQMPFDDGIRLPVSRRPRFRLQRAAGVSLEASKRSARSSRRCAHRAAELCLDTGVTTRTRTRTGSGEQQQVRRARSFLARRPAECRASADPVLWPRAHILRDRCRSRGRRVSFGLPRPAPIARAHSSPASSHPGASIGRRWRGSMRLLTLTGHR